MIYDESYEYVYIKPCAKRPKFEWIASRMYGYAGTIQTRNPKYNIRGLYEPDEDGKWTDWTWGKSHTCIIITSQEQLDKIFKYAKNKDILNKIDSGDI